MTTQNLSEGLERKLRSERILENEGVPIARSLPLIETTADLTPRTKEEVAYRAIVLLVAAAKADGLEQAEVEACITHFGIAQYISPKELKFFKNILPSYEDELEFDAGCEAAWTLLWALGYVESLGMPTHICDAAEAVGYIVGKSTVEFIAAARLRPLAEILDQADLIYRYDWAVVDAHINGRELPAGLEGIVVQQRHYALNWLIRYMDQEWDHISTDT